MTLLKNEVDEEYSSRITTLKQVLAQSKLSANSMRRVEELLRDNGADYFKVCRNDEKRLSHWAEYDLVFKYHGLGEDFIVYLDFD